MNGHSNLFIIYSSRISIRFYLESTHTHTHTLKGKRAKVNDRSEKFDFKWLLSFSFCYPQVFADKLKDFESVNFSKSTIHYELKFAIGFLNFTNGGMKAFAKISYHHYDNSKKPNFTCMFGFENIGCVMFSF